MKNEFFYHRGEGSVTIRTSGSNIKKLAAEIGYLIHNLYSRLHRQNPILGEAFKTLIIHAVSNEDSPTWVAGELPPGGVELMFAVPGEEA